MRPASTCNPKHDFRAPVSKLIPQLAPEFGEFRFAKTTRIVLLRHQVLAQSHQCVGRHQAPEPLKRLAPKRFALGSQRTPQAIIELRLLAQQFEHTDFFLQAFNAVPLMATRPASGADHQKGEWIHRTLLAINWPLGQRRIPPISKQPFHTAFYHPAIRYPRDGSPALFMSGVGQRPLNPRVASSNSIRCCSVAAASQDPTSVAPTGAAGVLGVVPEPPRTLRRAMIVIPPLFPATHNSRNCPTW